MGALNDMADKKLNNWLNNHQGVDILKWHYEQARYGDHSICIEYVEAAKEGSDLIESGM